GVREAQAVAHEREEALRNELLARETSGRELEQTISDLTTELARVRTEDVASAREQGRAQAAMESGTALQEAQQREDHLQAELNDARMLTERLQTQITERETAARQEGARDAQAIA